MKRPGLLLAAGVLLAADAVILATAARNRSGEAEARLQLTERELELPYRGRENTALALRLNWWGPEAGPAVRRPGWLAGEGKLRELGFDLSTNKPQSKEVYAMLALSTAAPETRSRLELVDAGRDLRVLRSRYPDRSCHAAARAVARLRPAARPGPAWSASIHTVPEAVSVPPEHMPVFEGLETRNSPDSSPRYSVTLCYGGLALPWICGARRTAPTQ